MNPSRKPEEPLRDPFADQGLYSVREERERDWEGPRASLERKNTLIYDADRPEEPPKFRSLLVESLTSVSSFGNRRSRDLQPGGETGKRVSVKRMSRRILDDEGSEIGAAL